MGFGTFARELELDFQIISRPAIVPAVRLEHPQVLLPADSNGAPQAMHLLTLIAIGDNPARRRAMFFCSMSFTTLGGKVLILRPSDVVSPPDSRAALVSAEVELEETDSSNKITDFPLIITLLQNPGLPNRETRLHQQNPCPSNIKKKSFNINNLTTKSNPEPCTGVNLVHKV